MAHGMMDGYGHHTMPNPNVNPKYRQLRASPAPDLEKKKGHSFEWPFRGRYTSRGFAPLTP